MNIVVQVPNVTEVIQNVEGVLQGQDIADLARQVCNVLHACTLSMNLLLSRAMKHSLI